MKLFKKLFLLLTLLICAQPLFAQKLNRKLAAQLVAIYQDDQQYRVAAIAAAKKYGSGSDQDNELMRKQSAADLTNLAKIEKIIAAHGYPGKSLVGTDKSKIAFMVVQHNDDAAQGKYLPLFTKAAAKGELDKSLLPLMIDRLRTAKGQPQLYGTQLREIKGGGVQIFPIEDEANVNIRRKKAGMPPLQPYLKQWGINYKLPTAAGNPNPASLYIVQQEHAGVSIEAVGGDDGIFARLQYPDKARESNITGFVTLELTIDKNGNTKDITVVKSLGYGCDEEAIRVMKETKYNNPTGEESEIRMRLPFPYKKS
jgi:TonB family protein